MTVEASLAAQVAMDLLLRLLWTVEAGRRLLVRSQSGQDPSLRVAQSLVSPLIVRESSCSSKYSLSRDSGVAHLRGKVAWQGCTDTVSGFSNQKCNW